MKRVRVLVRGRVQGVGFRASAVDEGRRLGLRGWARNLPSGEVEVEAEGEDAAVEAMVAWLRKGPPSARVLNLDVDDRRPGPDSGGQSLQGFVIRR
jgi:acylphosphatase